MFYDVNLVLVLQLCYNKHVSALYLWPQIFVHIQIQSLRYIETEVKEVNIYLILKRRLLVELSK